jgi:hypothetical protein
MDDKQRLLLKFVGEPLRALHKQIKFRELLIKTVRPELAQAGFEFNKGVLFRRGQASLYEFSRANGAFIDLLLYSNQKGYNPYVKTHIQMMNSFDIRFYLVDMNTKRPLATIFNDRHRQFAPSSPDLFPWGASWVYFTQGHLEQVLQISIAELKSHGLKWFDLARHGVKGDDLCKVLGTWKAAMSQEEFDRSRWHPRYAPN